MKVTTRLIVTAIISFIFLPLLHAQTQRSVNQPIAKIKGINEDKLIRIKPPQAFYEKSAKSTNFEVTYHGFTTNAKNAFQQAVDIWASMITSNQTIKIDAYWQALGENVLGSAGPTNFYADYDGMYQSNTYYPICLAEKMMNSELNDATQPDIIAFFNSEADWYYGVDGNTPSGLYDLTTVVLHEICHGLGFVGSITVEDNKGYWGWGDQKTFAFDNLLVDDANQSIMDVSAYPNASTNLKDVLCGAPLYFNGPITNASYGDKIKLYTPTTWSEGSSVYHLDRIFEDTNNTLMLHSINTQTSIHDPGPVVLAMLKDIGWNSILIDHEKIVNTENIEDVTIQAGITADYNTQINNPTLKYTLNNGAETTVPMSLNAATNKYEATIPVGAPSTIKYSISATDDYNRVFQIPVSAPEKNYEFYMGPDIEAPVIAHIPTTFIIEGQKSIVFQTEVSDNFGIDNVRLTLFKNEQSLGNYLLYHAFDDLYNISLNVDVLNLKEGDYIKYRLLATDNSSSGNYSVFPLSDFEYMYVEAEKPYLDSLNNQFETINSDFVLDGFEISTTDNFDNNFLQSKHPYTEGGEGMIINTTATTRYPILISENTRFLSYDELVLVEPGEDGTVFGDDDFYDYVIVEAKKEGETDWFQLIDGYDSRDNALWYEAYNALAVNGASINEGTPQLMKKRYVDLIDHTNIAIGDKIYIRFRLFSDPYTNGWGWAIDNVETRAALSSRSLASNNFKIYPNPITEDRFSISAKNQQQIVSVELLNLMGQLVRKLSADHRNQFEIPNVASGNYLLKIQTNKRSEVQKIIIQ